MLRPGGAHHRVGDGAGGPRLLGGFCKLWDFARGQKGVVAAPPGTWGLLVLAQHPHGPWSSLLSDPPSLGTAVVAWGGRAWTQGSSWGTQSPLVTLHHRGVTPILGALPGTSSQQREKAGTAGVKKVIFFLIFIIFKLIKNLQPVFCWVFFSLFFCFFLSVFLFVFFKQH